jgi:hypothetical protein
VVITDHEYSPLFDHDKGDKFQESCRSAVVWFLKQLSGAKEDIAAGRLRTLDWETRLRWRARFKRKILNACKCHGVHHAFLIVGQTSYLVARYKDEHVSFYRIEPAVPTPADVYSNLQDPVPRCDGDKIR